MVTRFGLIPRRSGTDTESFQRHWRGEHARLAVELPGIARYWQNHATPPGGGPLPWPGFDACAELDAADAAAFDAMRAAPQFAAVAADEEKLLDWSDAAFVLARRSLAIGEAALDGVRLLTFMSLAPLRSRDELAGALESDRTADGVVGREVFLAIEGRQAGQRCSLFDAIEALWFERLEDAGAYLRSEQLAKHRRELSALVAGTERLLATVNLVIPGSRPIVW